MKEQLDSLRLEIDTISQLVSSLTTKSTQLIDATKSLLLAKAWIGKLLGELGGTSPYKNDGARTDVASIEPTDARATIGMTELSSDGDNHIMKVDRLRQLISKPVDEVVAINPLASREASIARTQVWIHLTEARLHLGFELGRIREEADAK